MSIKPTNAQLLVLSAAARREDCIPEMPPNLKGAAARKVATKLIAAGLVKEIKAKTGTPAWRRDETEQSYALKTTTARLRASAIARSEATKTTAEAQTPRHDAGALSKTPPAPAASTAASAAVSNWVEASDATDVVIPTAAGETPARPIAYSRAAA
jgi:hypothetical protein